MFENFPKKRIELPDKFKKIYSDYYKKNRDGKTTASYFSQKMESWLHKKVAIDVKYNFNKSTLEIGAGNLNQLKYENTRPYDIVEPFSELFESSVYKDQVNEIYTSIDKIDNQSKYDRITSIATFEHIDDLPKVVAKTCVLLNENGELRVSIPNEGTFLWRLGWQLTTGLEFRLKYRMNFNILMRYEHVNTADEIEEILNYFYGNIRCTFWGISKKIALYRFYVCSAPKIDIANKFLKSKTL